jgi:uroporphyrinogen decarboxylase
LFESVAHLVSAEVYGEFALPYQQRVLDVLKGKAPTIMFARDCADMKALSDSGADVLSLPGSVAIAQAREVIGRHRPVQGNLDNRLLAFGTIEQITEAAQACVASGGHRGHIFNLNHGLLKETPLRNVLHLVNVVHSAGVEKE